MDTPTYIVLVSLAACIAIVIGLKAFRASRPRQVAVLLVAMTVIWIGTTLCGEFVYTWAGNATCSNYLGCVSGFFGYDAFEHLYFGVALSLLVLWLCERFPAYSIAHPKPWKTLLAVVSFVVMVSVFWEMLECAHDYFRLDILHEHLINFRLHINALDQPTNLDTMGDLTAAFVGSVIGFFL